MRATRIIEPLILEDNVVGKYLTDSEWLFNRQRMLVIDGKYNGEDCMSTGSL
jgi:hypothetical protein